MASEIRVNKLNSQTGVGTITLSPTGVDISGITTAETLKATTGIVTTLTATTGIVTTLTANTTKITTGIVTTLTANTTKITTGIVTTLTATTGIVTTLTTNTLTANSTAKVGSGVTLSPDGDVFATGVTTSSTVKVGTAVTITESGIAVAGAAVTASNFNGGQIGGRRNLLINGNFAIAQRGTSSTTMNDYFVDRWRTFGGPSGFTISRQDDLTYPDGKYGIRMHRTSGNSQTNNHGVGQGVETKTSKIIAGKTVTLSFKARRGANFSGSSNQISAGINAGEGTDENPFGMSNTNGTSALCTLSETAASYQLSFDVPSDKTQLTVLFSYTPSGTAGANDWFEIADCQLEVGEKTPFEILGEGEQFALCERYYQTFQYGAYIGFNFIGRKSGNNNVQGVMTGFPPMRAPASGTYTGAFKLYRTTDGSTHASSSVTLGHPSGFATNNSIKFTAECTGSFSTGNMATVFTSGSGATFTLDAEL